MPVKPSMWVAAALLFATPAAAQSLEGRVTEAQTQQPVPSVAVSLLDAEGGIAGRVYSDAAGAFRLRAPMPGEFRIRAERVGYRPTTTRALGLEAEQTLAVEVRIAPEPVALDTAAAAARRRGVSGRVLDEETGLPVAGATVTLLSSRALRAGRAVTDSAGGFHLRIPQPDGFELRAERVGYRPATSGTITLVPGDTVDVELRLSTEAVLLAPLTVVAASRQVMRDHQLAGFEWRRERQPFGRYLGPDDIRRINPFYASDVLQQLPFVRVEPSAESRFDRIVTLPARGRAIGARARCVPTLYLDGRPVRLVYGLTVDDLVTGRQVAAVEVYTSPGTAPGEFPARDDPFCGVVVIWTRV